VGLYTSPFLEVFNERIEYDGDYISDEDLEEIATLVCDKADEMVAEGYESPTEFEVVTAMAFAYFARKGCDYVVLEVGLGGRGDSTNVVKAPLCCVIASISLDHTDRLGETIPEIAFEKAGIIKQGCPVIVNTERPEALAVFRKRAHDLDAPLFDATMVKPRIKRQDAFGSLFDADVLDRSYRGIELSMAGEHQVSNAIAALYALTLLIEQQKLELTSREIKEGFRRARQLGRFEILHKDPYVIIDGAHNDDGARRLAETVNTAFSGKDILMVTGILADKAVDDVLDHFLTITDNFIVTEPVNDRRLEAEALCEKIRERGAGARACRDPREAVKLALSERGEHDLILFSGSLYLIGAIRSVIIDELR
jgi:dihydrofolate synthase/folylpolyglutamate synthase